MTKVQLHVILVLHNVKMEQSNVIKVLSNVILIQLNVTMEPLDVRKKIKEPLNVTKRNSYM